MSFCMADVGSEDEGTECDEGTKCSDEWTRGSNDGFWFIGGNGIPKSSMFEGVVTDGLVYVYWDRKVRLCLNETERHFHEILDWDHIVYILCSKGIS